ncbi:hypothetical protein GWK08_17545 [Leptobacterium flavescens]|uniref:Uncharacterized protein n=1 Tax=Leptobacterium flavescens TaxID=472055 RepID=A0A6P0UQ55_9FLAO|nr:hypothetical protein [Leptobacterium flavescens]NER15265.1 hypothetical protein [Leptobacterium flavescens]
MAKLTSKQARELAHKFLGLGQAIGDFRFDNWDELTKSESQKLASFQRSILNSGEDMLALSTTLVLDDVEASLNRIGTLTTKVKDTVKGLQNIQKGIKLAASIMTLGAAIISKNPFSIVEAIGDLEKAVS